jgi:thiol-disulfide isomerase/thioredoxin
MKSSQRNLLLVFVILLILGGIYTLESRKVDQGGEFDVVQVTSPSEGMDREKKEKMFDVAKEITTPNGYINIDDINIADAIGKKVILIDFWTYSCINCQRTTPFLNAWWDKYEDDGLLMIGIHTPEFEFEKDYNNVADAVKEFGIEFPVVLDNDFSTWRAYQNRYWPRKYLIDIDGFIVYDHIGEGGYDETEKKIQELLEERKNRLGLKQDLSGGLVDVDEERSSFVKTPEIYFGASRNSDIANIVSNQLGVQTITLSKDHSSEIVYLDGAWEFSEEFAKNVKPGAKIVLNYTAKNVFMVASAQSAVSLQLTLDGHSLDSDAGAHVQNDIVSVQQDQLYKLVEGSSSGEHQLIIEVLETGLEAFTFTFG